MAATRAFNVSSYGRVWIADGKITVNAEYLRQQLVVVVFATRLGGGFTDAQVDPAWAIQGKVKALGQWFADEDFWYVIVARKYGATQYPYGTLHTVATAVDQGGLPEDTPLKLSMFSSASANSVTYATDVLTGYLDNITPPVITPPDGDYGDMYSNHIAAPGPHYLMNSWTKEYGMVQYPGEEYDTSWYRKWRTSTWREELWVVGKTMIEWPTPTGMETERRTWFGATTMVQRFAFVLSAAAPAPEKPVITRPVPGRGWVDPAKPWRLEWTGRGGLAGAQAKYWVKVTRGATVSYRSVAAQVWTSTPSANTSALPYADFPAGSVAAGDSFSIQVATQGTAGGMSPWSDPVLVSAEAPPTGQFTIDGYSAGQGGGAGTVSTLTPMVVPSGAPGSSTRALTSWVVEVLDGAGTLMRREEASSMAPLAVGPLVNGGTYTIRAQVMQDGGALSDPVSITFTVAAAAPGAPTVRASTVTHETAGIEGVSILTDFPWDSDGFDWAGQPVTLIVERAALTDDGEADWVRVGEPEPLVGSAAQLLRDWYLPEGEYRYRVRAEARPATGGTLAGGWGYSNPVPYRPEMALLVPDGRPELGMRVRWVTDGGETYGTGGKAEERLGSPYKAVRYGTPSAPTREITVRTDTPQDSDRLRAILQARALLWVLGYPETDQSRTRHAARGFWARAVEDVDASPWNDKRPYSLRNVPIQLVEQPAPYRMA